jgi:hypothetical protein
MIDRLLEIKNELMEMQKNALSTIFKNVNDLPKEKKEIFEQLLKAHISGDKKKVEELEKKLKQHGE